MASAGCSSSPSFEIIATEKANYWQCPIIGYVKQATVEANAEKSLFHRKS
jgi:hypothetical protein